MHYNFVASSAAVKYLKSLRLQLCKLYRMLLLDEFASYSRAHKS